MLNTFFVYLILGVVNTHTIYFHFQAGVSRVVVGLRHPLEHFRDKAIYELRNANMKVDILGEDLKDGAGLMVCLKPRKEKEEEEDLFVT